MMNDGEIKITKARSNDNYCCFNIFNFMLDNFAGATSILAKT